jgi:hypothetical protein
LQGEASLVEKIQRRLGVSRPQRPTEKHGFPVPGQSPVAADERHFYCQFVCQPPHGLVHAPAGQGYGDPALLDGQNDPAGGLGQFIGFGDNGVVNVKDCQFIFRQNRKLRA